MGVFIVDWVGFGNILVVKVEVVCGSGGVVV